MVEIASIHELHVAPAEVHQIKRSLWSQWMAWSGSYVILSILIRVVILAAATLKFTLPLSSPVGQMAMEDQVKAAKSMGMTTQSISKRIIATAVNASVALPVKEMSASSADLMGGSGSSSLCVATGGGAWRSAMRSGVGA